MTEPTEKTVTFEVTLPLSEHYTLKHQRRGNFASILGDSS